MNVKHEVAIIWNVFAIKENGHTLQQHYSDDKVGFA